MKSLKDQKIIIVTHYLLYGSAQALVDYLSSKKIKRILYIGLPLVSQRQTFFDLYAYGRKVSARSMHRGKAIPIIDYVIDVAQTVHFVLKQESYDTFIGVDGLNCLAGLFLRRLGKVRKVIFYSIDFVPVRFKNSILNKIYHTIEIFCVKHADESWNVSSRIAEGRESFFGIAKTTYNQKVVPIGIWNKNIKKRSFNQIKKHQILFMGHLLEKQGVQAVLDAIPLIRKQIPGFRFIIVGGGEYDASLKQRVKQLQIQKHVTFTGWITKRSQIDDMMSESAVAVATYKPEKERLYNFTYYADPTKLKDYLGAGLPIILTDISYNAKDIAKKKCGILVKYDRVDIAKAIIHLLKNEKVLQEYRKNALAYAQEFDWEEIFDKVFTSLRATAKPSTRRYLAKQSRE